MSYPKPEKDFHPHININESENVNRLREEADRIEDSPEAMLALVDMIFGFTESKFPPS